MSAGAKLAHRLLVDEHAAAEDADAVADAFDLGEHVRREQHRLPAAPRQGELVEEGSARAVLHSAGLPYTRALIASVPRIPEPDEAPAPPAAGPVVLEVEGLHKSYRQRGGLFGRRAHVDAVAGVGFRLVAGETVAVVGESGSGKTTLSRCLVRLVRPDRGRILLEGEDLGAISGGALRTRRPVPS